MWIVYWLFIAVLALGAAACGDLPVAPSALDTIHVPATGAATDGSTVGILD